MSPESTDRIATALENIVDRLAYIAVLLEGLPAAPTGPRTSRARTLRDVADEPTERGDR